MRRCGYLVTSLPGTVLLTVLTCLEQVTNDGRGITTRKLRDPPPIHPPRPFPRLQHKCAGPRWITRLAVKVGNHLLVTLLSSNTHRRLTFPGYIKKEYFNQLVNHTQYVNLKDNCESRNQRKTDDKKYVYKICVWKMHYNLTVFIAKENLNFLKLINNI